MERSDRSSVASQDFALTTGPAKEKSFGHSLSKGSRYGSCFMSLDLVYPLPSIPDYQSSGCSEADDNLTRQQLTSSRVNVDLGQMCSFPRDFKGKIMK